MTPQTLFTHIGTNLKDTEQGKRFGKPRFKTNGKAFACFFQEEMVFKLDGHHLSNALSLVVLNCLIHQGRGEL